jgi:uncharacterized protein YndB with AHSA1/START domain
MATNAFHIVTTWHVTAPVDLVAAILTDAPSLPRWWPDVYRAATITAPGDARNIGRKVAFVAKGKLPYHINWTAELLSADLPRTWEIAASGDLTGRGIWTLQQDGPVTVAHYDWQVHADRPLFRILSPVLAPVFAWNHRWAMARGEAGLQREVIRRRAG